jgi:hypothetical protein
MLSPCRTDDRIAFRAQVTSAVAMTMPNGLPSGAKTGIRIRNRRHRKWASN